MADDPLARELVMASSIDSMIMMDQRDNRMVPVEICAVNIGYQYGEHVFQTLPPRTAEVEQFCSWSACRMNSRSSASAATGSTW